MSAKREMLLTLKGTFFWEKYFAGFEARGVDFLYVDALVIQPRIIFVYMFSCLPRGIGGRITDGTRKEPLHRWYHCGRGGFADSCQVEAVLGSSVNFNKSSRSPGGRTGGPRVVVILL